MTWTYYSAFLWMGGSAADPHMLMRLRSGYPEFSAERLDRSGEWMPSSTLIDIERGGDMFEVEQVTREQAVSLAVDWLAKAGHPQLPDDLL